MGGKEKTDGVGIFILSAMQNEHKDNAKITISRETGSARNFQENGNPDSFDITVRLRHRPADN